MAYRHERSQSYSFLIDCQPKMTHPSGLIRNGTALVSVAPTSLLKIVSLALHR